MPRRRAAQVTILERGGREQLRRYWRTACAACPLKSKCTTGPERRIPRWEYEHLLDAGGGTQSPGIGWSEDSDGADCSVPGRFACPKYTSVVDGDLPDPRLPIVPGHEIVGIVDAVGARVSAPALDTRVGIPWLGHTCGHCSYCLSGRENLCDEPLFTGYTRDGVSPPMLWRTPPMHFLSKVSMIRLRQHR